MNRLATALRIQRRELDSIRVALSVSIELRETIETSRRDLDEQLRHEHMVASVWMAASDAWRTRVRTQRTELDRDARNADAQLADLRRCAAETYGKFRALESVAERQHEEDAREMLVAEQNALDDIAAIALLRARRAAAGKRA